MTYEGYCKVMIPEGKSGSVAVKRFEIEDDFGLMHMRMGNRGTLPGQYTKLTRNGHLWMSDTHAEFRDSARFLRKAKELGGRVLINGLGLGVVVGHLLECDNVEHIDVVEIDEDVIKLVAPSFDGERVTVHHADAYCVEWPKGTRWQSAWHDIWLDICEDDLKGHERLNRKYGGRVDYQECWAHDLLLRHRRQSRELKRPWF
jgi:hypothetical protein